MGRSRRIWSASAGALVVAGLVSGIAGPLATAHADGPVTAAFLDSESSDTVGNGQAVTYSSVTLSPTSNSTSVEVTGTGGGHSFDATFTAPTGQFLGAGLYNNASQTATVANAGLTVTEDGHTCTLVSGRFRVDEITFAGPIVATFSARLPIPRSSPPCRSTRRRRTGPGP